MVSIPKIRTYLYSISYVDGSSSVGLSWFNKIAIALTLFAISLSIVTTEKAITHQFGTLIQLTEFSLGVLFTAEIAIRVWSVGDNPKYSGLLGRLRFLVLPSTLLDILATIPLFILTSNTNTSALRVMRLIRLGRFVKLGRYSSTLNYFAVAIKSHWPELAFSFVVSFFFLFLSATTLYMVEGIAQPDAFGSIPRSLWWAVATLTTVGYGDVYPITVAGKFAAGIIAIIGIGAVALPAGIFAAAFSEAFQAKRLASNK